MNDLFAPLLGSRENHSHRGGRCGCRICIAALALICCGCVALVAAYSIMVGIAFGVKSQRCTDNCIVTVSRRLTRRLPIRLIIGHLTSFRATLTLPGRNAWLPDH